MDVLIAALVFAGAAWVIGAAAGRAERDRCAALCDQAAREAEEREPGQRMGVSAAQAADWIRRQP